MAQFESPVDRAIREAAERGAFTNLAGAGRPLQHRSGDDFLRRWAEAEEEGKAFLPMSLQLRKEAEGIHPRVARLPTEQQVRTEVDDLNRRIAAEIRTPTGEPPLTIALIDVEDAVARWRSERQRRAAERAALVTAAAPEPTPGRESRWRRWFRTT